MVDQTRGDASVTYGNADEATFREMLLIAREENPGARIIIKTHPETEAGHRAGYYSGDDAIFGAELEKEGGSRLKAVMAKEGLG